MKQILSLLIVLLSISSVYLEVAATDITSAKIVVKHATTKQTVSLGWEAGKLQANDMISFVTSTPVTDDISIKGAGTPVPNPLTGAVTAAFTTSGIYNIYFRKEAITDPTKATLQNVKQVVVEKALAVTSIASVSNAKVDTDAPVKFTLTDAKTMYNGDKITFSMTTEDVPSTDEINNQIVTLKGLVSTDFTATEFNQTIKFTKKGIYKIWIEREGVEKIKQTATLVVDEKGAGSFIAISLALLLGIFLF